MNRGYEVRKVSRPIDDSIFNNSPFYIGLPFIVLIGW